MGSKKNGFGTGMPEVCNWNKGKIKRKIKNRTRKGLRLIADTIW